MDSHKCIQTVQQVVTRLNIGYLSRSRSSIFATLYYHMYISFSSYNVNCRPGFHRRLFVFPFLMLYS